MHDQINLPIHDVLDQIVEATEKHNQLILAAPPGAGKTTIVPLRLLDTAWQKSGKIILVEPRRLAARAAAKRMADLLGEKIGARVGYRMRLDTKVSKDTIIEVVTEGVFTRMVLDQPDLEGISCVIFDEFHERALDADFGLALALDVQEALREDLRIIVMSATLDTDAISALLNEAPIIESGGRSFPIDTIYKPRPANLRIEDFMVQTIMDMLHEEQGSILAFLPGQGEIRRVAQKLTDKVGDHIQIMPLYGTMPPQEQDRAIKPAQNGHRKVVLATSIAETSITIDGVRIVIDSGLQRQPVFEAATGMTRLETVRVSQASAKQRAGRAGRTEPGIALRLWQKEQHTALQAFTPPQILTSDLSTLILDSIAWGVSDLSQLKFITPAPDKAIKAAKDLLVLLGALDDKSHLTEIGHKMRDLSLPVRLSAMMIEASKSGDALKAAKLSVLLTEQGLGGQDIDLDKRLKRFDDDKSARAHAARGLANRLAQSVWHKEHISNASETGALLAHAFPDRITMARGVGRYTMSNGRGAVLDEVETLAQDKMLVIADLTGKAQAPRVLSACRFDETMLSDALKAQIIEQEICEFDRSSGGVRARLQRRLGAITLSEQKLPKPSGDIALSALAQGIQKIGIKHLPIPKSTYAFCERVLFLKQNTKGFDDWPDLSQTGLMALMDQWFSPYQTGVTNLKDIDPQGLAQGIMGLLSWEQNQELNRLVPDKYKFDDGETLPIRYTNDQAIISVRVQRLFGQKIHPSLADGRIPLLLELLSPAGRPIQLTGDLLGFWAGSWRDVCADMRGRYPKHPWPDDPANATPPAKRRR